MKRIAPAVALLAFVNTVWSANAGVIQDPFLAFSDGQSLASSLSGRQRLRDPEWRAQRGTGIRAAKGMRR